MAAVLIACAVLTFAIFRAIRPALRALGVI